MRVLSLLLSVLLGLLLLPLLLTLSRALPLMPSIEFFLSTCFSNCVGLTALDDSGMQRYILRSDLVAVVFTVLKVSKD